MYYTDCAEPETNVGGPTYRSRKVSQSGAVTYDSKNLRVKWGRLVECFAALMMLGVKVREVANLGERAIWLPRKMLLLIDQGLSGSEREIVADRVLPKALDLPRHQPH